MWRIYIYMPHGCQAISDLLRNYGTCDCHRCMPHNACSGFNGCDSRDCPWTWRQGEL